MMKKINFYEPMTKQELEDYLKDSKYTEEDLDFMWNACASWGHSIVSNLSENGLTWRNLTINALKTLPLEFEKMRDKIFNKDETNN